MTQLLDQISAQATRLRESRPGIADYALRAHAHLSVRLAAAKALPEGEWRNLQVRAVMAQAEALVVELSRLSAPAPGTAAYEHGGAP